MRVGYNTNERANFCFTFLDVTGCPWNHSDVLWEYIFLAIVNIRKKTLKYRLIKQYQ
jgi:hypothetical protein